jgi:KDO2-lipid IV(A) lauroyltransferase
LSPSSGNSVPFRWRIEFAALRALRSTLRSLSPARRLKVARQVGRLAFRVAASRRRTALRNLELALPELPEERRREIALSSFEHLGRLLGEILLLGESAASPRVEVRGNEHLERVVREGKGYFLVSGHFGNWELIAHHQAASGRPLWMVTRPSDNTLIEDEFARIRTSTGNRIVHKRQAVREIVRGLKSGVGIGVAIDQNYREADPHFVPFFGRSAATTRTVGTISVRMGAPILPVFAYPRPDGSYLVEYEEPIYPPDTPSDEASLRLTEEATRRIENAIRRQPEPWFWMHQRWKTRPPGESKS